MPDPSQALPDGLRTEAINALAQVLRAPDAKPADRLRAAEALLKYDTGAGERTPEADAMSDADLLRVAKGEGGTPPERGSQGGGAVSGPMLAQADSSPRLPKGNGGEGGTPEKGGPKEDPPKAKGRGRPKKGPKLNAIGHNDIASNSASGDDPDPWT